jgi:hypothetical protein
MDAVPVHPVVTPMGRQAGRQQAGRLGPRGMESSHPAVAPSSLPYPPSPPPLPPGSPVYPAVAACGQLVLPTPLPPPFLCCLEEGPLLWQVLERHAALDPPQLAPSILLAEGRAVVPAREAVGDVVAVILACGAHAGAGLRRELFGVIREIH